MPLADPQRSQSSAVYCGCRKFPSHPVIMVWHSPLNSDPKHCCEDKKATRAPEREYRHSRADQPDQPVLMALRSKIGESAVRPHIPRFVLFVQGGQHALMCGNIKKPWTEVVGTPEGPQGR